MNNCRLFVETLDAFQPAPVGCSDLDQVDVVGRSRAATLGAIVKSPEIGRRTDEEVTVYKAMGVAMEDLVAANLAYCSAVAAGVGTTLIW